MTSLLKKYLAPGGEEEDVASTAISGEPPAPSGGS